MVDLCKKIITALIISAIILSITIPAFSISNIPDTSAKASVLMIAGSNEVLYSKNSDEKLSMASTTKIMTAIIAIENGDLNKTITISDKMTAVEGTSSGLLPGDKIDLLTLLYCMMLQSGNDAANATAFAVSGSIEEFLRMMNDKARKIGMKNTHFCTVSGLDADDHYSTAYDMALLASYAINNDTFREICSTYKKTVCYGNPEYNRTLTNHNKLLKSYDGLIGVKTGFTKKSGRCLVSAAERLGVKLICVTLDDYNDWADHKKLLDYGFDTVKAIPLKINDDIKAKVVGSAQKSINVKMLFEPKIFSSNSDFSYSYTIELQHFLYAPVKKDDIVGRVLFYDKNGNMIYETPLVSSDDAKLLSKDDVKRKYDNGFSFKHIFKWIKGEK